MKKDWNINFYKDLYMDSFFPEQEEFYTIIHFHGGGLVEGDKGDTHDLCKHLADLGFAVFTCNYHLLPNAKFPEFLKDAAKAVKYVIDNVSKYGKSKGFIISGQSAGAWLTLMLCFNKEYLKEVGVDPNLIIGWISDSAQTTSHFHILEYELGLNPWLQRIDKYAPLYYINENVNFSHLLLTVYEDDMPNRLEQNKLLLSTVKNFNKGLDIELHVLPGDHCHGSCRLSDDGEYDLVKLINEWKERL